MSCGSRKMSPVLHHSADFVFISFWIIEPILVTNKSNTAEASVRVVCVCVYVCVWGGGGGGVEGGYLYIYNNAKYIVA